MKINAKVYNDNEAITVIQIQGSIDTDCAIELEEKLMGIIKNSRMKIIIDCHDITYLSSTAIGVFAIVRQFLSKEKGKFALIRLSKRIKGLFHLFGFNKFFNILPTLEKALELINKDTNYESE